MHKLKKILTLSFILGIPVFVSGYGYTGNLPELGEKTEVKKQQKIQVEAEIPEIKPASIIIPRPGAGHKINKYSTYLSDIKEINALLTEIKTILQEHSLEKIQLFCAKVNLLNLYADVLEEKYAQGPERHYESYRQLLVLDKYLTEIVDYRRGMEEYRRMGEETLEHKIQDEKYLKQKVEKTIIPINTVIEIIEETG